MRKIRFCHFRELFTSLSLTVYGFGCSNRGKSEDNEAIPGKRPDEMIGKREENNMIVKQIKIHLLTARFFIFPHKIPTITLILSHYLSSCLYTTNQGKD